MFNDFSYSKESAFISKESTNALLGLFNDIYETDEYKSSYPNVRVLYANTMSKEPLFAPLFDKILKKLEQVSNTSDLTFSKLWLVSSSSSNTDKDVLPYIPHFDKTRYLKAMVCLQDITINQGPIHFGKVKDPSSIEKRRLDLPSDYQMKGLNIVPTEELEGDVVPLLSESGDVIFFDTNTPHKAGIVAEGCERKVLRFDFEVPGFNSNPSMFSKVLKRVFA